MALSGDQQQGKTRNGWWNPNLLPTMCTLHCVFGANDNKYHGQESVHIGCPSKVDGYSTSIFSFPCLFYLISFHSCSTLTNAGDSLTPFPGNSPISLHHPSEDLHHHLCYVNITGLGFLKSWRSIRFPLFQLSFYIWFASDESESYNR